MSTRWVLQTHGDPLGTVQVFLNDLYGAAGVDHMLVPVVESDTGSVAPVIVDDADLLRHADPFAPVMTRNSADRAAALSGQYPGEQVAAVMRPCELRALVEMSKRQAIDEEHLLVIGVDCLGTFPVEDDGWLRNIEHLTERALQFCRQGGIAMYRHRPACQSCTTPMAEAADVSIELLGLPAKQMMMVTARDEETARRLHLDQLADDEADDQFVQQRAAMREKISLRRGQARTRQVNSLADDMPHNVDELIDHLTDCMPCQKCLDACPIYAAETAAQGTGYSLSRDTVERWLASCAQCGMCEEVCTRRLPLSAIFGQISRELDDRYHYVPGRAWEEVLPF